MNKSTKILIAISLICNVLFLGIIMGRLSNHGRRHCKHHHKGHHKYFDKMHAQKFELMGQIKTARGEVFKVLTAEKFDPELYQQKADKLHQAYAQVAKTMTAHIKETATGLSQEERMEMAEELRCFRHKH